MPFRLIVNPRTAIAALAASIALAFAAALPVAQAQVPAGTLKKIADSKTISLGYRTEAAPFSFAGADGRPAGYSVDLCANIAARIGRTLKLPDLAVRWVPVTAADRLTRVTAGDVDLECGTTTVTLGRQEQVDFSNLIFADGGSWIARADGPRTIAALANTTIGVLPGTTTEPRLRAALAARKIDARVIVLRTEQEGVVALADGRIQAFANDRISLVGRVLKAQPAGVAFTMADEDFSFEPYGLMMRRDPAFRLAVNRALAGIYGSEEIVGIYGRWFGALGRPGPLLASMYYLGALEE